ncbi:MAG: hypothetical protein K6A43_11215 [Treponema sp.]|nr:hypothetical protein [Treponema sp.]
MSNILNQNESFTYQNNESSRKTSSLLERFLLISVSTSFVVIALYVLNASFTTSQLFDVAFKPVTLFVYAMVILSAPVYAAALDFFIQQKTPAIVHGAILIPALVAVVIITLSLQQPPSILYSLIPASIVLYIICAYMNNFFLFHENFLNSIEGMNGEKLRAYLFNNKFTAGDFGKYIKRLQGFLATLGFITFLLLFGGRFIGAAYNLLIVIFVLYFYTSLFISFILTGLYNREIYYSFLGFNTILKKRQSLFAVSLLILLICSVAGFAISSNRALIKIKPLEFTEKDSIKIENPVIDLPIIEDRELPPPEDDFFLREFYDEKDFSMVWYVIDIVAKVLMCLGAAFLLFMLIFTFARKGLFRAIFKEGLLAQFFKKFFRDFKDFLKILFHIKIDEPEDYSKIQTEAFSQNIQSYLNKTKKSREKRNEIDRLTKIFMTLIDWGSRRKIIYTQNLAPAEYTELLQEYFAKNDRTSFFEYTKTAGDLFEKALYDKNLLSQEEETNFKKAVRSITTFTLG